MLLTETLNIYFHTYILCVKSLNRSETKLEAMDRLGIGRGALKTILEKGFIVYDREYDEFYFDEIAFIKSDEFKNNVEYV